ncbi:hypothetical protein [Metabacillus litoralis]|uniref:hypothetical protein n=1 Tax=Metabacillus litoralis TaxID=152268 RepID=UPI00203CD86F|nr:hypothetical protein [Metabacillus litoralis]MCM3413566.1 hypothetical protein [Metabacillus litoralis]
MYVKKDMLKDLMIEKAQGNYNEFARQLYVGVGQLHKIINGESEAGPKFLGKLMVYCTENNLDFKDYIFLNKPFTTVNGNHQRKEEIND